MKMEPTEPKEKNEYPNLISFGEITSKNILFGNSALKTRVLTENQYPIINTNYAIVDSGIER